MWNPILSVQCSTDYHLFLLSLFPDPKEKPKAKVVVLLPGCNKFVDPKSPLVPEQLILWSEALVKVDQDPHLRPDEVQNAGYTFPDSTLFITVTTEEKMITYLKNWLQYCPTFIYCVSSAASSPCPLSLQTWRTFLLSANYADVKDSSSTFQSRWAEIMAIIGGLDVEGVSVKLDPLVS